MQAQTTPPWDEEGQLSYPQLSEDIRVDVVIIGGGLAGVISAFMLCEEGKKVALLEQGILGSGATGRTTAFITQAIDTDPSDLISMLGIDNARLVWESGATAISMIAGIVEREGISCDFTPCSAYLYAQSESQSDELAIEAATIHSLGFAASHVRDGMLGFKNAGYLTISNQAKCHPLKFLSAVASMAQSKGVRIFEHTAAVELSESGAVKVVTRDGHTVHADDVIVATHVPFSNPKAVRFKKAVYRSYVLDMRIPKGVLKEGMYWDQSNPYTYFRIDRDGDADRLMLGGADHRADLPFSKRRNLRVLYRTARELLRGAPLTVLRQWDGPIIESVDGLPFIGAYGPHRYLATAFSGNGMTYSVVASMILRDALTGKENPWAGLYSPTRKSSVYSLVKNGIHYIFKFFGGIRNTFRGA